LVQGIKNEAFRWYANTHLLRIFNNNKEKIMKQLKLTCREIGVDCDVEFLGITTEEIMQKAAAHASSEHNLPMIPPNIYEKCVKAIKEIEE